MTLAALAPLAQFDGGQYGSLNCGCTCTAMQIALETGGAKQPSGSDVRAFVRNADGSPDTVGGTRPAQNVDAARRGFGVTLDARVMPFEEAWDLGQSNWYAISISMSYAVIHGTEFDACPTFTGLHQVLLHAGKVYDPLADHRRVGIPQAPQVWPKELLKVSAGRYAGIGYGKAAVIVAKAPPVKPVKYSARFTPGSFWIYSVAGDYITGRVARKFAKVTSAPCSAPQLLISGVREKRRLVQITKGALNGQWVEPGSSHVSLTGGK